MSSRLRTVARWITAVAVTAAYAALHLLVNVGMGEQVRGSTVGAWWCGALALALLGPALWLRHRRRSGVAEIVALVDRYGTPQPRRRGAARIANAAGCVLSGGGALAVAVAERNRSLPPRVSLLLVVGGLAAAGAGFLVLRRTRPYAARGAAQALLRDGRRPVLYLRSFDDEAAAGVDVRAAAGLRTREVQFAAALGAVGPVIAVGRPGETLPPLGAARFYLPLDDWQGTVRRLMDLSQLIVLRLGPGEGLRWEIGEARATQPPAKLVLLAPRGLPELAGRLNESLPTPLLPREMLTGGHWIGAVITFDGHWTPRVFPVKEHQGPAAWRWMARSGISSPPTPTVHLARTIHTALKADGRRQRAMAWRAQLATRKADLVVAGLALALVPPGWLGYRILQLAGRW